MSVNGSRSINQRRTHADMAEIRAAILEVLAEDRPMTVRQVYYRLTVSGAIEKTEKEYKTVVRVLTDMRRSGEVPFPWIADNTRSMRKPYSCPNLESALRDTVDAYRRSYWDEQPAYVEVWLEKDALSGVFFEVTRVWDVPLMVTRGYPSISFLHDAGETIAGNAKRAFLYYFGDHDPSGVDITRAVEEGIREFAPGADVTLERIAVTEKQIEAWNLPTRPTKTSDARSKDFDGESVEVDAIPPKTLRGLIEECICRNIDGKAWTASKRRERFDRRKLASLLQGREQA